MSENPHQSPRSQRSQPEAERFADFKSTNLPPSPCDEAHSHASATNQGVESDPTSTDVPDSDLQGDLFEPPLRTRSVIYRTTLMCVAFVLIGIGIALIPFPVLPGAPLIIVGSLMLAASSAFARGRMNHAERKLPRKIRRFVRKCLRRFRRHEGDRTTR